MRISEWNIQCHNYLPVVKKFTSYLEIRATSPFISLFQFLSTWQRCHCPFRRYCKRSATLSEIDNSSHFSSVDNPVEDRPVSNPATNASPAPCYRHNSQTFQQMVNLSSITDHHPFCTFSHQQHGDLILFCQGRIYPDRSVFFHWISRHSSSESLTTSASCSA